VNRGVDIKPEVGRYEYAVVTGGIAQKYPVLYFR
jgi:hypothetical protein